MSRRKQTINDNDRQEWVLNDEGLHRLWKASGRGLTVFVRENRSLIDGARGAILGGKRRAHYLAYGD